MDFTREPIIETVITPKEGFKIVVRSSKAAGQEEYFVDAVEVVSFGRSQFFRSLERPKAFLVPVSDYEILEVREARMVLKNVGLDRSIKIGGGREASMRTGRETAQAEKAEAEPQEAAAAGTPPLVSELRSGKRDKRTRYRKRKGRDEGQEKAEAVQESGSPERQPEDVSSISEIKREEMSLEQQPVQTSSSVMASLLAPPPTLISETIARYKDNVQFKGAFYSKEEEENQSAQESQEPFEEQQGPASYEEESGYPSLDLIDEQFNQILPNNDQPESQEEFNKE